MNSTNYTAPPAARDTIRVRSQQGVTTLVGIDVRPRVVGTENEQTVAGTFWIDLDRIAIARARFGFSVREGRFLTATETGTFLELENALIQGRYWLPYRQRREIQIASPLFGGAAALLTEQGHGEDDHGRKRPLQRAGRDAGRRRQSGRCRPACRPAHRHAGWPRCRRADGWPASFR